MKDAKTLAYINLYAILGTIPLLCEYDEKAKELASVKKTVLSFNIKGGPSASLRFENGKCEFYEGCDGCDIKLGFSSPEKFNGMIDGTVTPIPSKGLLKVKFLLKNFIGITDILTKYLRASEEDLENAEFFEKSTRLMFSVIVNAVAQIGNNDSVGRASASYITDGVIRFAMGEDDYAYIEASSHFLRAHMGNPEKYTAYMSFDSISLARKLFDGKVNAVSCVGLGDVRIGGMVSQVDNVNRILDRVELYLA